MDFLSTRNADIVALQETTPATVESFRELLPELGLAHVVDSFRLAPPEFEPGGARRYGQLLASRLPLAPVPPDSFAVPWPERILSATLRLRSREVELHTTHIPPGSSNGWVKVETLQGLYRGLAAPSDRPRIVCGDFNTPQHESASGEVATWGQRRRKSGDYVVKRTIRGGHGGEWDRAERNVLLGLAEHDLPDVFRSLHGYGKASYSWYARNGTGRRYDHILASVALRPVSAIYLDEPRAKGLSDHAPIEATFSNAS